MIDKPVKRSSMTDKPVKRSSASIARRVERLEAENAALRHALERSQAAYRSVLLEMVDYRLRCQRALRELNGDADAD